MDDPVVLHPGQQVWLRWTVAGTKLAASTVTVTGGLTDEYCSDNEQAASGPDPSLIVATAPVVRLSGTRAAAPVSVVTIPRGIARGGNYCLWTHAVGNEGTKQLTSTMGYPVTVG